MSTTATSNNSFIPLSTKAANRENLDFTQSDKASHKVRHVVGGMLAAILVIVAMASVGARLAGLSPYAVLSGSMEPTYPVGSIVYVAPVDTTAVQVGQVITFATDENTLVTHRVIENVGALETADTSDGIWYRTQGDANTNPDANLVSSKNIIGTPVFCIPLLGYVGNFLHGILPAAAAAPSI